MLIQSVSTPLQGGIRFFRHPLPAFSTVFLTVDLPCHTGQWRKYGLTEFHNRHKDGLGPAYSPMTQCQRAPRCKRDNQSCTILVKAYQQLWLHAVDGVYQQFTYVGHTNQPSVSPACCSQGLHGASRRPHTTESWDYIVRKLRTPPLPATHYP